MSVTGDDPTAAEAPTQSTPTVDLGQTADRCATCGADLAPDQRYCVDCGTRRGRARFDLRDSGGGSVAGPVLAPDAYSTAASSGGIRSISSSAALLGTVACLLLAILVGYLIGHGGNHGSNNTTPHVTINENGGGGTSSGTAATGSTGATASSSNSSSNTSSGSSSTKSKSSTKTASSAPKASGAPVQTKAVTSKQGLAAAKKQAATTGANNSNLGISSKHAAPATQKIGAPCKAGESGCVNGKYTGAAF